jgi:hypothetical protein
LIAGFMKLLKLLFGNPNVQRLCPFVEHVRPLVLGLVREHGLQPFHFRLQAREPTSQFLEPELHVAARQRSKASCFY